MIMPGIARVAAAMMWLVKTGTMCLKIMRAWEAPASWAAITKSSSRSDRNLPRTTRAMPVQLMIDRMTVMAK